MGMNEAEYNLVAAALQEKLDNEYPHLPIRVLNADEVEPHHLSSSLLWMRLVLEVEGKPVSVERTVTQYEAYRHLDEAVARMTYDIMDYFRSLRR
ncbi:hypothetical protein Rctr71_020 [Virus Rctr71]|nr:hypothetical protein Rctr71_020 [Virus Rctr71]